MFLKKWKEYDPSWLVEASKYRLDEYPWLTDALVQCTKAKEESEFYTYFINRLRPNKKGSEWQFQESITIEDTPEGDVVIDIVKTNRIGGIEFLSKVIAS